jgi:hypothetical protein
MGKLVVIGEASRQLGTVARGRYQSLPRCRNASQPTRRDFIKTSALVAGAGLAAASAGSRIVTAAGGLSQAGSSPANKFLGYVAFQDENRILSFTLDKATGKLDW